MSSRAVISSPRRSSRRQPGPTKNEKVRNKEDRTVTTSINDDDNEEQVEDDVESIPSKARKKQIPKPPSKRGRNQVTDLTMTKEPSEKGVVKAVGVARETQVTKKMLCLPSSHKKSSKKVEDNGEIDTAEDKGNGSASSKKQKRPKKPPPSHMPNGQRDTAGDKRNGRASSKKRKRPKKEPPSDTPNGESNTAEDKWNGRASSKKTKGPKKAPPFEMPTGESNTAEDKWNGRASSKKQKGPKKVPPSDTATSQAVSPRRISLRLKQNSTTKIRPSPKYNEADDDDDYVDDGDLSDYEDGDDDDEAKPSSPKRRGPKRKKSVDQNVCPHCDKEFSSVLGLTYHLAKWVCRKEDCPDPAIVEKSNRKRGRGKAHSPGGDSDRRKWKKFRGPEDDRICPRCKRVFTSSLGLQYHVKNNVCKQTFASSNGKSDAGTLAMHPLQPGERFVTVFGVVEVIKDDRAIPTAVLPQNLKKENEQYLTDKKKLTIQATRAYIARSMRLRARRMKINALYSSGKINRESVAQAYSAFPDPDPDPPVHLVRPTDPAEPPDSFPERIVECVLVPDTRPRIVGREGTNHPVQEKEQEGTSLTSTVAQQHCPTKLFLQRRVLQEPYHVDGLVYLCQFCNMKFGNQPGQKYHVDNNVCLKRGIANKEKRKAMEKKISKGAKSVPEVQIAPSTRICTKKPKRKQDQGMYPEVLIALGFQVLPEKVENVLLLALSQDDADEPENVPDLVSPEEELQNLQAELKNIELKADIQKYGSMYSEVYRSLGFRKPGERKVPNRVNDVGTKKRRRRASKPKPVPPPKPLPPIIDIQALVDEIDVGRYPSLGRYKGDAHQDRCSICKDGGDLYCCDFCTQVEHLSCLRERFTVKEPEPDEDFMCHNCIQSVLGKRKRAEKRRALKQEQEEEGRRLRQQEGRADDRAGKFQSLASKGQQLSELVELLEDAQLRLRQACETAKLNNLRRQIIEAGYQ